MRILAIQQSCRESNGVPLLWPNFPKTKSQILSLRMFPCLNFSTPLRSQSLFTVCLTNSDKLNIKNQKMMNSMNKQSLSSLNKISIEMDRLSYIINKQQLYHNQLQTMLKKQDQQSNESSVIQNFDEYFKEYDNPTTKSLPIDQDNQANSQIQEQDTEIMNTIYRNRLIEESEEEDKENVHDDKSTVILNANKIPHKKQKEIQPQNLAKPHINYYSSVNQDNRNTKKEMFSKSKKNLSKNPTSSMPSQIFVSAEHQKSNVYLKNGSVSKYPGKVQSPVSSQIKSKKNPGEGEYESNFIRELKGKLSKVSKIDRQQLNRLQQKKVHKKTELSSNRKKTKRDLGTAKSTTNMIHTQKTSQTNITLGSKSYINSSCKILDTRKKDSIKKNEQKAPSNHEWQRNNEKVNKKLNRINICKLQENMKKNHEKKSQCKDATLKKTQKIEKKITKKENERKQLKLHFTQNDETAMRKLIDEKQLNRQYTKETDKYMQAAKKISKHYFQILIKQCRQTSEEAIFKIKLVTLILYFFDQFASSSLITHVKIDPKTQEFFTKIPEEQIIDILLHPKRILKLMSELPSLLINDNVVSSERYDIFNKKFQEINDQLDQQLQFFLIKKTMLFMFVHSLLEYINFLIEKELIAQTKRTKLVPLQSQQKLQGYYSSRSKRDQISKKYIKKTEKSNKFGFRCDSDRKITLQDQQIFLKGALNNHHIVKTNPLKKIFK